MARATLSIVKDMVFENLSISPTTYGTLDTDNKRFKLEYINDAIAAADIKVVNLLRKYKQDFLLVENYQTQSAVTNGASVDPNWSVVSVTYTESSTTKRSIELPYDKYRLLTSYSSSIFNSTYNNGYHTFKDGKIYHNSPSSPSTVTITYLTLTHPDNLSALKSPAGFESVVASFATAQLLMKRMDRPQESQFYANQAYTFLQEYGIPESPKQETSDLP